MSSLFIARIILVVIITLSASFLILTILRLGKAVSTDWGTTPAELTHFDYKAYRTSSPPQVLAVTAAYTFNVGGITYNGTKVLEWGNSIMRMSQILERFQSEKPTRTQVYYNRENPSDCFLVKISKAAHLGGMALTLGIGGLCIRLLTNSFQNG